MRNQFLLLLVQLITLRSGVSAADYADNPAVQLFQEYLRINTTSNGDLSGAVDFWTTQANDLELPINVYEYVEGYPVIVIQLAGCNSSLESIMINSHMDVVPADASEWTYPPFDATLTEDGEIWARGSQDMKSLSIQYLEGIRRLKDNNITLLRDVYLTLMPDEEVGGQNGMVKFLESDEFAAMNVGAGMDESGAVGIGSDTIVLYQDKCIWQIQVECVGESGHSVLLPLSNQTAIGKCRNIIDTFQNFRDEQYQIAATFENKLLSAGLYTSVNINTVHGGTANNVIAEMVKLVIDIRPAISVKTAEFEEEINQWMADAGNNVTYSFLLKNQQTAATVIDDTNPYWVALQEAATASNVILQTIVDPGATDSRYVRLKGIPAFGLSPIPNTTNHAHAVDERLSVDTFLAGIDMCENILTYMANIPAEETEGIAPGSLVILAEE